MKALFAFAALLTAAAPSYAACTWQYLCNEMGQCKNMPVCDSSLDLPPPAPPTIAPIAPPSIRPIAPPTLPPLGTSNCTQVQAQDAYGNWRWKTVCY